MNQQILTEIIHADIARSTKEEILEYWLLPPKEGSRVAPIQKSTTPSGSIKRPTKEQLDLKANPRKAEELEEMEKTLDEVVGE